MSTVKAVWISILIVCAMIVIGFTINLGELHWKKFFDPKYENVRREVFKETRSFNEAKVQELIRYRLEYMRTDDPIEQGAIASTIRMSYADYDTSKLPNELQVFVDQIKYK